MEISKSDVKKLSDKQAEAESVDLAARCSDFGRIAAQTAKLNLSFRKCGEAERDVIYAEFKDKIGQIVSGTVMRKEKK